MYSNGGGFRTRLLFSKRTATGPSCGKSIHAPHLRALRGCVLLVLLLVSLIATKSVVCPETPSPYKWYSATIFHRKFWLRGDCFSLENFGSGDRNFQDQSTPVTVTDQLTWYKLFQCPGLWNPFPGKPIYDSLYPLSIFLATGEVVDS